MQELQIGGTRVTTMNLTPNKSSMGVRIDDIDLSKPVSRPQFATILSALGRYGVICFPKQTLDARVLKAFSQRFGSLQGSPTGDYCEPGYAVRINETDEAESDEILAELTRHQLQPKYQYAHQWTEGDVLMWDHIGTLHAAIPDYRTDEHRLIKRCQVMADRIFDPAFVREHLAQAAI